jgi:iron complex outermembrane receptor protein
MMSLRRTLLVTSASGLALACGALPAFAADGSTTVGEIIIPGIRQSLQKAIEVKRINENQVDAISATDIGKLPDKNVADALQRLPGVNTTSAASGEGGFDENDRVSIRGTSPSLTEVTVDGHTVSTGDWFILDQAQTVGRSVSFLLLPSEIVQNVIVYKTQDASQLEGGVAGSVDVQTRGPLDQHKQFIFEGSAEGVYNSNSGEVKPQLNGLMSWKNNDGTFGAMIQGFYEKRSVERFGQEVLGWTPITSDMPIGAANPALVAAGTQVPTLIGSTLFEQERTREGVTGSVEWRSSDEKAELKLSGFYSHLNAGNFNYNYMFWGTHNNVNQGEFSANMPTSFTVLNNTVTAASFPLLNPSGKAVDGLVVDNITRPNESADSYYVNLDGKFHLGDRLTVKTQVGFTKGKGITSSQPALEFDAPTGISYAASGNGFAVTPLNINPQSPAGLADDWSWNVKSVMTDQEIYGKFDADFEVSDGPFKDVAFGARVSNHKRQTDTWDRGCTLGGTAANPVCFGSPNLPFAAADPTSYPSGFNAGALGIPGLLVPLGANPNTVGAIINAIPGGVRGPISAIVQPQNYYFPWGFKVEETDVEGYIMAHVGGERWRGNFGVRIADTDENPYVNIPVSSGVTSIPGQTIITSSAYGPYYVDHVSHNYLDFLPSVNFTFDVQPNLLLRVSAAETMSRPDYSALGGTVSLTTLNHTGNGGNPDLKPIKAAVYDAALEWYYAPTAVAAVSVFYDDLSSYVTYGVHTATYFNIQDQAFEQFTISSPQNTSGELKGVELQIQQPIAYGFGFQANGTYINSHEVDGAPLVGTSKWTGNLVGYYEAHGLSVRLAYTYRSHFFVGLDRSSAENQANYGTLDGSISYQVTPNIALTVDALNITNATLKYYAQNPTQVRAVYDNGTQVYFGVKVKF